MAAQAQDLTAEDLAFARAAHYRFLAAAFAYPRSGAAAGLRQALPTPAAAEVFGSRAAGVREALEAVWASLEGRGDEEIESAHIATYGHTMSDAYPPHETRYGSTHPFQESQDLADIAAFYRAFGLQVRRGAGERVDHAWMELEFLHFLALKELVFHEKGEAEGAARSLGAAKVFLRDHLGRWGPVFGDILAKKSPLPLTRAFGSLLAAVIRADLGLLEVTPGAVSPEPLSLPPEPVAAEGDDESGGEGTP